MKCFMLMLVLLAPIVFNRSLQAIRTMKGKLKCKKSDLQLKPILLGGQSFRWRKSDDGGFKGVIGSRMWTLFQSDEYIEYNVTEKEGGNGKENKNIKTTFAEYDRILSDYLRLDENLEELYSLWSLKDPTFKNVADQFYGVRILRQDPVENVFSFLCTSNNNIPRITSMIEKLCKFYGEKICEFNGEIFYDFPTAIALAHPSVEAKLRKEGFGYRAKYIHDSATRIMDNGGIDWFKKLQNLPYGEAKTELMKLNGVGAKIADCICLMSLNHLEAIPVDTHVFQISQRYMPHLKAKKSLTDKTYNEIGDYFRNLYGKYAGWAQTVLFCADLKMFQVPSEKREVEGQNNLRSKKKKTI